MKEPKIRFLMNLLKNRTKSDAIVDALKREGIEMDERQWRRYVRAFNNNFANQDRYIVSNKDGYMMTSKKDHIRRDAINKMHHALAELKNAKATLDELGNKSQLALEEGDADIYDLVSKML